jgi:hypothetical protein
MTLALLFLRGRRKPFLALVHGLVGAAGFGLLLLLLRGPRRGEAMGVGSFGEAAAVLFGVALVLGLLIALLRRRAPRVTSLLIASHSGLAVTGFVLFLAWVSVG